MKKPVKTGFSVFRHLLAPLLIVAYGTLHAADENSMLMGGLAIMGNDGASEAGENPAYLTVVRRKNRCATNTRLTGVRSHNVSLTGIPVIESGQWFGSGDIGLSCTLSPSGNLAIGVLAGDVRMPNYQQLKVHARVFNAAVNGEIDSNLVYRSALGAVSFGIAYRFSASESLGLRIRYGIQSVIDKGTNSFQALGVQNGIEDLKESTTHVLSGQLSYLWHNDRSDWSLMLGNLGMQYEVSSFARSASGLALGGEKYDTIAYSNRAATEPFLGFGTRQRLFADFNLFAELGAQAPVTTTGHDNVYRDKTSITGVVHREYTRYADAGFAVGSGFSAGITGNLSLFAGARAQKSRVETVFGAESPSSRHQKKQEVLFATLSAGASYRFGRLLLQSGLLYYYNRISEEKTDTWLNGSVQESQNNNPIITLNGYGLFLGVSADF